MLLAGGCFVIMQSSELVMAVGLVVDYMVHIVHYYLHQASERHIRR